MILRACQAVRSEGGDEAMVPRTPSLRTLAALCLPNRRCRSRPVAARIEASSVDRGPRWFHCHELRPEERGRTSCIGNGGYGGDGMDGDSGRREEDDELWSDMCRVFCVVSPGHYFFPDGLDQYRCKTISFTTHPNRYFSIQPRKFTVL